MMKAIAELLKDHQESLAAFKWLSSDLLFALHEEIERLAIARMEEEKVARKQQATIAEFKGFLAQNGITPDELLAFTKDSVRASKRNR